MSIAEIEKEALTLTEKERARLALSLLETLPADPEISDDEALKRDADLQSGQVAEILHEEFVRRVERERRR